MHDILSARLARLANATTSTEARKSLKSELLDLAKLCQIVPTHDYLIDTVAGPLAPVVQLVFGSAALIVALTERSRRQVYFAIVAQLQTTGQLQDLEASEDKRRKLMERLILASSADLIAEHFGSCPHGFLRLLTRIGERARPAELYLDLHKLLTESPGLAKELLSVTQKAALTTNLLSVILHVPRGADVARLAQRFDDIAEYERFIDMYRILTGHAALDAKHRARLCAGERPSHLLDALYLAMPFPAPAIAAPGLRYVKNGVELVRVAKTYRNCLSGFVAEALKGEHQYYIWTKKGAPSVVLCLHNEAPFGWFLAEMREADNARVSGPLKHEVKALLAHCGVRTAGSIEDLMRPHRYLADLNDYEELFDLDAA